jgi:hypothetical protein
MKRGGEGSLRVGLAIGFGFVCVACTSSSTGGFGSSFTPTPPCTSSSSFAIGIGNVSFSDLLDQRVVLTSGTSRLVWIHPSDCQEIVTGVRWSSSRPEVAGGFLPGGTRLDSWLVTSQPGETEISAQISFTDGRTAVAPLKVATTVATLRVVAAPAPPAGRRVLLAGVADLTASPQSSDPAARAYLGFEVPASGTLDIVVDWTALSSSIIAIVCRQAPPAFPLGCSPVIIDGNRFTGHKPVVASIRTTAGSHTLWLSNGGPAAEKVRYEAGFVPE